MTFPVRSLGDLCRITSGGTPSRSKQHFFGGGVPWVTITDMLQGNVLGTKETLSQEGIANSSAKLLPKGTVLISIFATIGRTAILGIEAATNQAIAGVIPNDPAQLDSRYLKYFLDSQHGFLNSEARGVAQPNINQGILKALKIALPPLREQLRIVDILSRADSIVRLRRDAQQKAAELVPAIFLDMFGDPATNPKGWPMAKFGDYLTIESVVRTPDLIADGAIPCIGADSIESGSGKAVSWPTVEQIKPISGKYRFEKNDVLYSKIRPALRKAIVAPETGFCSADMYPLRPKKNIATPEFVAALLLSNAFTEYAIGVSARAQMPKVNRETLFAYEHPMPPVELQRAFVTRIQNLNSMQRRQEVGLALAELAFSALLGKSFSQ